MKKFTILLAAFVFASPAFSEEVKDVKVEVPKHVEETATDASKTANAVTEKAKATTVNTEDAKKTTENIAGDVKKAMPVAAKESAKKELKAASVKRQKMGKAGGKGG